MSALATRRNMLAMLAVAPAVALPALAAVPGPNRAAWDRAMAAFLKADAAMNHHNERIYLPLNDELERIAPKPDFGFHRGEGGWPLYVFNPEVPDAFDNHQLPDVREAAPRTKAEWIAHRETSARLGVPSLGEESDRLCDERCDRNRDVICTPAPDHAALFWKIDQLFGEAAGRLAGDGNDVWCGEFIDALIADAARLLADA